MIADLHIHTTASDGCLTAQEVLAASERLGLRMIAITDHDTVDAHVALQKQPYTKGLTTVIPGIEFSTDVLHSEVHILGYHIDIKHDELNTNLTHIMNDRINRARKIVDKLSHLGYPISFQRVREIAGDAQSIGRPHIAKALVEQGFFSSVGQVFHSLLKKNGPAYFPHYKLTPLEVSGLIHRAGGLAVLAHPGLIGDDSLARHILTLGLDGIEAIHPAHSTKQIGYYHKMAISQGLLVTGGSDFHGVSGRFPEKLGEFTIPIILANKINEAAALQRSMK